MQRLLKSTVLAGTAAALLGAGAAQAGRGDDGHVSIIYWQAPSILNPYLSGGTKDVEAASLVIEPLARYDQDGNMVPWLAEEIPTVENGGVAEDLRSITWKLRKGIKWSDGSELTAEDVVFTAQYCMHPEGGCAQLSKFEGVEKVEAVDAYTVRITFSEPKPFPYGPFVGATTPVIQKAQFQDCLGARAPECTEANFHPVGTGPFRVVEFKPNDVITMEANPNYRDPDKPAFATLTFKGGGDATSAARAVLQTGEFDYAWNLQIPPDVLANMEKAGKGKVISGFGTLVERLMVNLTDPSPNLPEGERSTRKHPHPFLTDPQVREALSLAIDRKLLTEIGYGKAGRPGCNVLPAPAIYRSDANDSCLVQDIERAKKILEEDGWVDTNGDGVRERDGVELRILYQTSTNQVRQDFQALIKQWWAEIGVATELRNIDASVFFGSDPASPDTYQKFYADIEMYANNFDGTDPEAYMASWKCGREPRPETQWQGENMPRFCNAAYDALVEAMGKTASLEKRAELAKMMNDILMKHYIIIPLVERGRVSAHSNTLGGVVMNTWDSELWNAADWYRIK